METSPESRSLDQEKELETFKAELEKEVEKHKAELIDKSAARDHAWEYFRMRFRALVDIGIFFIKSMFLLNGGSAVALLTYNAKHANPKLIIPVYLYASGVVVTLFGGGMFFIFLLSFYYKPWRRSRSNYRLIEFPKMYFSATSNRDLFITAIFSLVLY